MKGKPRGLVDPFGDSPEMIAATIEGIVYWSKSMDIATARSLGEVCNVLRAKADRTRARAREYARDRAKQST